MTYQTINPYDGQLVKAFEEFPAEGKVKADIEMQPLSSINGVLDRLEHDEVASRVVLESENWST